MFNAVAYGDRLLLAGQPLADVTVQRLALKQLDDQLCLALQAQSSLDDNDYVAADRALQHNLLFSNRYLPVNPADKAPDSLEHLLARQRQALGDDPTLLAQFAEKLTLLQQLGCFKQVGSRKHTPEAWTLYYAWRKLEYLRTLEADYYLHNYKFDTLKTYEQLVQESDLLLAFPAQLFEAPKAPQAGARMAGMAKLQTAPVLLGDSEPHRSALAPDDWGQTTRREENYKQDARAEYYSVQKQLADITANMRSAAAKVNSSNSVTATKQFAATYGTLVQQRDACTYLLERKKAEMGLVGQASEFVKDNMSNHKAAAMAALQAMWAGAGVASAHALLDALNGKKVDTAALGKRLAITAGIAAGTALATYLLGPLGPMLTGPALGYFFPQPDPLREGLNRIESAVNQGFSDVKARLQVLDSKIDTGFAAMTQNFADWSNYVVDKEKFNALVSSFQKSVLDANQLLDDVDTAYEQVLHPASRTPLPLPEGELFGMYRAMQKALDHVVKQFYHRSYSLLTDTLGSDQPDTQSIAQLLIAFYRQPSNTHFRPFHLVCRELLDHCERVQLLVDRYFAARAKLQEMLAVVAVFYATTGELKDKRELHELLLSLAETEDHERATLFAGAYGLGRKVLGANNHALYQQLMTYWDQPRQFNLLRGFGLLNPVTDREKGTVPNARTALTDAACEEWFSTLRDHQLLADAGLSSRPRQGSPVRYYVAPPPTNFRQDHYFYHFYTMQENDYPRPLVLHMALDAGDRVVLYNKQLKNPLKANAVPLQHALFDASIERFWERQPMLTAQALAEKPVYLELPRRPFSLRIGAGTDTVGQSKDPRLHAEVCRVEASGPDAVAKAWAAAKKVGLGGGTNYNYFIQQLTPVLTDTAVGLEMSLVGGGKQVLNLLAEPDGKVSDDLNLFGLWSTNMALGYPSDKKTTLLGPNVEPHKELLPFRYVLYADETLTGMYAANGRFQLRFGLHDGYESVLYTFSRGGDRGDYKQGKSVFSRYEYRDNRYEVEGVFQTDGNLVLYEKGSKPDARERAITATDSAGNPYTFVHLTDKGLLLLRDLRTGTRKKDIGGSHNVNLKRQDLGNGTRLNRLYTGWQLHAGQSLTSINSTYTLGLEWVDKPVNNSADDHLYGCALVLRTEGLELERKEYLVQLPKTLKHPEWDKCTREQIDFLDDKVGESSRKITWLQNEDNGTIRGRVGTYKTWMAVKSEYGMKELPPLCTGSNQKVYLELTILGAVVVRAVDGGEVKATIFEPR